MVSKFWTGLRSNKDEPKDKDKAKAKLQGPETAAVERERQKNRSSSRYLLGELIDTETLLDEPYGPIQFICDIDKTYIETKFESAMSMLKIAFEQANEKVTVNGASLALLAGRWGDIYARNDREPSIPRPLHFLSASPPQLRRVIRDKLARDGLDWTSDTFKNQAYNLRMGRLKLLKQHVAYKTATILSLMQAAPEGTRFILIGDNAELDAYIYTGVQLFMEKRLTRRGYCDYLTGGGVDKDVLATLEPYLDGPFNEVSVAGILIRRAPGYSFIEAAPLTQLVIPFDNYFEVTLHFYAWGLIPVEVLWPICRQLHNEYGYPREELVACLKACQRAFEAAGKPVQGLQDAMHALVRTLPLNDWPERKNFQPGRVPAPLDLPEATILEGAHQWVQAIARRDHK